MQSSDIAVPLRLTHARAARGVGGFTLIELMIVVAVVAILAAIAYPSYQDAVRKSRRGQAKADLVELAQRAERFHTVNNTYAGFWATVEAAGHDVSPRTGDVHYILSRDGGADAAANTFVFSAVPQGGQANDTRCMTLTLNQAGTKDIDGGSGSATDCW